MALANELALAPVTLYRLLADDALRPLPRLIPVEFKPVASTCPVVYGLAVIFDPEMGLLKIDCPNPRLQLSKAIAERSALRSLESRLGLNFRANLRRIMLILTFNKSPKKREASNCLLMDIGFGLCYDASCIGFQLTKK